MPNQLEQELGIAPVMHRFRRWLRNLFARMTGGFVEPDQRSLDPLTVNYAVWREVRRSVREWPQYLEAPNSVEVLVSPEDWEDYWGIDTARKEEGISAYVSVQATKKRLWMAGDPQILVLSDDTIEPGELEIICQFVEPEEDELVVSASTTASLEPIPSAGSTQSDPGVTQTIISRTQAREVVPTETFVNEMTAGESYLVGEGSFRMAVQSGDCIGAVRPGESVPEEVNVRLDADAFPYVAAKQCTIGILDGRWAITNHSPYGTKLVTHDGTRLMLREPMPHALHEGDMLYLGTDRPLRFELRDCPKET